MLRRQLEDRRIRLEKTGSIAEAALALSGVFEAAQKAADLYIQSVRDYSAEAALAPKPVPAAPEKAPLDKSLAEPSEGKGKKTVSAEKKRKDCKDQKTAETKQEKKAETAPEKAESPKMSQTAEKTEEKKKPQEKTEKKAVNEKKTPAAPQKKTASPQPAADGKPPKEANAGKDTDEFIASLKEYLGM